MSEFTDKSKALHTQVPAFFSQLRKNQKLTMRALSERIGTPHSFVGKTEKTQRRMDLAEFVVYCEGLELDPRKTFDQLLEHLGK